MAIGPMTVLRRIAGDESGSGAVEYALVAPVLMLMFVAIFDAGLGALAFSAVERSAQAGARFAATNGTESASPATEQDIEDFVKGQAIGLDADDVSVSVTWINTGSATSANNDPGDIVQVTVTYQYNALLAGFVAPFGELSAFQRTATLNIMN